MKMDTPKKLCYNIVLVVISLMYSSMSGMYSTLADASCELPEDLTNTLWEYNYTDVADNLEKSTILNIANTTLPNSVINLNAFGTTVSNWTCINSLDISDTTAVVVFKGDERFRSKTDGPLRWLYLCMKLTKAAPDLYYFHLLSDIETALFPNERVFMSEANNAPADNASICSTFCQYTESLKIITLRRQGSSATLPSNVSLCEPCDGACEEATTIMSSLETTQKTTLPSTSTEIDNTTDMTSTETTNKTTISSTSTEIGTTTDMISLETSQKTTIPSTSTDIDTTTQMTITKTTPKITLQTTSTSSEMETTTDIISTTTRLETKLPSTPNQMKTTTEITLQTTKLTSAVHYTVIDLDTTPQTTIRPTSKDTESTTNMKVTTDLKDKTTLETQSTDTENLKRYSGPILLTGLSCIGFVLVIIFFCLLKGRSMVNTERITNTKAEEAYGSIPETCYIFYKGKKFGFQKIAMRHWDNR